MKLKTITQGGVAAALQKAERYRLLTDSAAAESICLDILAVDPANQQALVTLLLAITDQFRDDSGDLVQRARDVLPRLKDEYKRAYYAGIVSERKAKALLHRGGPGVDAVVHEWLSEAMRSYEKAESQRPSGNDEAILRWNACARMLEQHQVSEPTPDEVEPVIGE